jgi:hypothetical protein
MIYISCKLVTETSQVALQGNSGDHLPSTLRNPSLGSKPVSTLATLAFYHTSVNTFFGNTECKFFGNTVWRNINGMMQFRLHKLVSYLLYMLSNNTHS